MSDVQYSLARHHQRFETDLPFGGGALGVVYFTGVKLVGYSIAGRFLNRDLAVTRPRPLIVGAARTALGIGFGVPYALLLSWLAIAQAEPLFLLGLVPLRALEWRILLWLFYRQASAPPVDRGRLIWLGIVWSFGLDIPAIIAVFALPGGFWIC